jgi:hypothetical protein
VGGARSVVGMRRRSREAEHLRLEALVAAEVIRRMRVAVGPKGRLTWGALKDALCDVLTQVRQEGLLDAQAVPMTPRVLCLVQLDGGGDVHLSARVDSSPRRIQTQPAKVLPWRKPGSTALKKS